MPKISKLARPTLDLQTTLKDDEEEVVSAQVEESENVCDMTQ